MNEIVNLVKSASDSLEKSLSQYWPVVNPDKNGLQEINLTMHVAAKALESEMMIYPEASHNTEGDGHKRIDLLVKGDIEGKQSFILFESKKLYSAEKAHKMASDLDKMEKFELVDSDIFTNNNNYNKYFTLIALTVREDIKDWWCKPGQYDNDNNDWDKLREKLLKTDTKGFFEIKAMRKQYVLYAVFR